MPQVDKATFFPIVFWTFTLYIGGYLVLNLNTLFCFFSSMKLVAKRGASLTTASLRSKKIIDTTMNFPLVSL